MTRTLIDRRGHLAQLGTQSVLAAIAFVTTSWIPLAAAGVLFTVSAVAWPRGALVLRVWDRVSTRWGARWLDDGRPARISAALAAVNFTALAVVVALGYDTPLMWAALLAISGALAAEVVIGACVPCEVIVWASRQGLIRFRTPIGETR